MIQLYETFETKKHIVLVIELCAGGDLLNYVRKRRKLKEEYAKYFFKQIIEGIKYIHSKNITHRDIKLDNILLDIHGRVKIADFGVSKLSKPNEFLLEQCGTPAYIAPEILLDQGYLGSPVDVWSAGVVLFSMVYGTVPFKGEDMNTLHTAILGCKFTLKDDVSKEVWDLIKKILVLNPEDWLTTDEILGHDWLKDAPDTMNDIFTDTEKEWIKREFSYKDTHALNRNTKPLFEPGELMREEDDFTEHGLESSQNSLLKNNSTKSVVLAPFNSTFGSFDTFGTEIRQNIFNKYEMIRLGHRVRETDRQYEYNNNCELDNGVYNKFMVENMNREEGPKL